MRGATRTKVQSPESNVQSRRPNLSPQACALAAGRSATRKSKRRTDLRRTISRLAQSAFRRGWIPPRDITAFARRQLKVSLVCLLLGIALSLFGHRALQSFSTSSQTTSLSAPANVTATDNAYSMKVAVEWNAVRGATLYRIFRNTTKQFSHGNCPGNDAAIDLFRRDRASGRRS